MAKKKKYIEVEPDEIEVADDAPDSAPEREIPELEQFLTEYAGSDFVVKVYKLSKDNTSWEICRKYPLDQFDADLISDEFGGGKYKVKVFAPDGTFRKQTTLVYANKVSKEQVAAPGNQPMVIQPAQDNASREVMQFLREEIQSKNALMLEMMKSNRAPDTNPMQVFEQLKLLKSLMGDNSSANQMGEIMKIMEMGMNLGSKVAEVESDMSPTDTMLKKLGEALIPMLAKANLGAPGAPAPETVQGAGSARPPVTLTTGAKFLGEDATTKPPKKEEQPMPEKKITIYKNEAERFIATAIETNKDVLLDHAKGDIESDFIAGYIAEQIDDELLFALAEYLKTDRDRVLNMFAEFLPYKAWVFGVFDSIIEIAQDIKKEQSEKTGDVVNGKEVKENEPVPNGDRADNPGQ